MTRIEELIESIDLSEAYKAVEKLDKNDPSFKVKKQEIVNKFRDKICNILNEENLEVRVAFLDYLFNMSPAFTNLIISRKDKNILDAQLVLERLSGIKPSLIKDEIKALTAASHIAIVNCSEKGIADATKKAEYKTSILNVLHEYVSKMDNDELEDKVGEDTQTFADNLDKVDKAMFPITNYIQYPLRHTMICNIFVNEYMDYDVLSKVFNNVSLKNPNLAAIDYGKILEENVELLYNVKGIYRKCTSELFDLLCYEDMAEDDFEDLSNIYKSIIDLNKEDDKGLRWFFKEVSSRLYKNEKLRNYLLEQDYFKEYGSIKIDSVYNECIDKFMNGNSDIDESLLEELGSYKGFINKFDELLDKFVSSDDKEFKRTLAVPLVVALIEKQRDKYDLDFKNVFTSAVLKSSRFGSYDNDSKVLYINPIFFKQYVDVDRGLVKAFDTVFHETRHAYQHKVIENNDSLSYDNLVMAIDSILKEEEQIIGYSKSNYEQLSTEKDARDKAYVDTMTLLRKYPELQKKLTEDNKNDYRLHKYIRRETFTTRDENQLVEYNNDDYYGIVDHFYEFVQNSFIYCQNDEELEFTKNSFEKYPVINQFFEIDYDKRTVRYRTDEELRNKANSYKEGSIERKDAEYSIKAFNYARKVGKYIKDNNSFIMKRDSNKHYDSNFIEEVINNVGKSPTR